MLARFEASRLGSTVKAVECRSVTAATKTVQPCSGPCLLAFKSVMKFTSEIVNRKHARIGALTTSTISLKFSPLHSAGKLTQLILFPVNDVSTCKSFFPLPKPAWAPQTCLLLGICSAAKVWQTLGAAGAVTV